MNCTTRSDDIIVSIFCLAYNHEKFIGKALDSFLFQKTNFKYEIIVHDDASTDNTAKIIRDYCSKNPDIIKAIYQTENQYSKGGNILQNFIFPVANGVFFAWCEGDDYWSDEHKLQWQVDSLLSNPNCGACFTKVQRMTFQGEMKNDFHPQKGFEEGVVKSIDYMNYTIYPGMLSSFPWQISGLMVRSEIYKSYICNPPIYKSFFNVGDMPFFLYVGLQNDVFYIDKAMSCYRTGNEDSFVGRTYSNNQRAINSYISRIIAYQKFDEYTEYKYHDVVKKIIDNYEFFICQRNHDFKKMNSPELKYIYDSLPVSYHIYQYVMHFLPFLEKPAKKIQSLLRGWNK